MEDQIGEAIRKAFEQSDMNILALSKRAGLSYSSVHDFLNRPGRLIYTNTASKLCAALGLETRPIRKQQKRKGS